MSGAVKSIGDSIGGAISGITGGIGNLAGTLLSPILAPLMGGMEQPQQPGAPKPKPTAPMSDDRRSRRGTQRRMARKRKGTGRSGTMLSEDSKLG